MDKPPRSARDAHICTNHCTTYMFSQNAQRTTQTYVFSPSAQRTTKTYVFSHSTRRTTKTCVYSQNTSNATQSRKVRNGLFVQTNACVIHTIICNAKYTFCKLAKTSINGRVFMECVKSNVFFYCFLAHNMHISEGPPPDSTDIYILGKIVFTPWVFPPRFDVLKNIMNVYEYCNKL